MREQREPLNLYVSDFDRLLAEKKNLEAENKKLRETLSMWLLCAEAVKDLRLVQVATKTKKLLKEGK